MSDWTPTRQGTLKGKNFLRFPWCLPVVCNAIVKINNEPEKQEFYSRRINLSNMDWILFNSNHCRVTETASSNINSGFQRKFGHFHSRWNYFFFFFPRVSFWMPCDFTVRAPSWTHFASISCVQFCSPESGIYFMTLVYHRWNSREFVIAAGLFIVFSHSFQLTLQFILYGKLHSQIIRYVVIMLTIYFAHRIWFYWLKLHQLRSTI